MAPPRRDCRHTFRTGYRCRRDVADALGVDPVHRMSGGSPAVAQARRLPIALQVAINRFVAETNADPNRLDPRSKARRRRCQTREASVRVNPLAGLKTAKQIFPKVRRNEKTEPKLINIPALDGPSAKANENEQNYKLLDKVEISAKSPCAGSRNPWTTTGPSQGFRRAKVSSSLDA